MNKKQSSKTHMGSLHLLISYSLYIYIVSALNHFLITEYFRISMTRCKRGNYNIVKSACIIHKVICTKWQNHTLYGLPLLAKPCLPSPGSSLYPSNLQFSLQVFSFSIGVKMKLKAGKQWFVN